MYKECQLNRFNCGYDVFLLLHSLYIWEEVLDLCKNRQSHSGWIIVLKNLCKLSRWHFFEFNENLKNYDILKIMNYQIPSPEKLLEIQKKRQNT